MQTGLYVLSFNGLAPRIRSPLIAPANGDTLVQGTARTFRWRAATNQNEDPHYYELHIWGPGVDTLLKTQDTSLTVTPFPSMQNGQIYRWHVWIKDEFTEVSSQDTFQLVYRSSSTDVKPDGTVEEFRLMQNYPNPFNPATRITFTIHRMGSVRLSVYDVLGREVATLVNEVKSPGTYDVQWDASGQPSGIYFYKLEAGNLSAVRKMALIR